MRVALVHDYLSQDGGAERVLRAFHDLWPEAPVYTLLYDEERANPVFRSWKIRTSFLQKFPGAVGHYRWYLPLMPTATESYDLSDYDFVLSSSSAFAKGVLCRPETLHISYCHTPTRYLWTDTHSYLSELNAPQPIKAMLSLLSTNLRVWDRLAALRADRFIANSENVRERIRKYYGRQSVVIHPPVDLSQFSLAGRPENFYLTGGRLVSYKRFDLVVRAFNKLGLPLRIFGTGPEEERLRQLAGANITFHGRVSDVEKAELYRKCLAFLHPQLEDFGITAIEAMGSGRPVIAYPAGGALETVIPGETGVFLQDQTWENLAHTVIRFDPGKFSPELIRSRALQFDSAVFKEKIRRYVQEQYAEFRHARASRP
ncbi:glycosyltransferase family 4 protein [Patescibacteria group bacterium]|nr:MAG: glycosyltransferase family 4 protein [Patescibacteria group bacterium]